MIQAFLSFCPPHTQRPLAIFGSKKRHGSTPRPVHILLVSHEASRTGAPKIALNLLRNLREKTNADLTTILHEGGPLHPEFERLSETHCLDVPREHHPDIHRTIRKLVRPLQNQGKNVLCICNSAESRFVANSIFTRQIPILYLLHEFPTSYNTPEFEKIYRYSSQMVFPCESVLNSANDAVPIPEGKATVRPQGLLDPDFGTRIKKANARKLIRSQLNLPEDAHLVLGCGTIDLRKGVDHFVNIARTHAALHPDKPVHFVWVGDGPRHPHSAFHYLQIDLQKSGQSNIHLVGQLENVEPYFVGADSFLLTSRVDPFPCVIHEAMAARLPILLFDQSGGAADAVGPDAGLTIRFGDHVGAVESIQRLQQRPALGIRMGEAGYSRVHRLYRFDDYADQIIQLCETQLGQPIRLEQPVENAVFVPRLSAA